MISTHYWHNMGGKKSEVILRLNSRKRAHQHSFYKTNGYGWETTGGFLGDKCRVGLRMGCHHFPSLSNCSNIYSQLMCRISKNISCDCSLENNEWKYSSDDSLIRSCSSNICLECKHDRVKRNLRHDDQLQPSSISTIFSLCLPLVCVHELTNDGRRKLQIVVSGARRQRERELVS